MNPHSLEQITPTKFSLKTLLIFVTSISILLGLYKTIGSAVVVVFMFAAVATAGVFAHRHDKPQPFWFCVIGASIQFLIIPALIRPTTENEMIAVSVTFGIGMWLAHRSVRGGHWMTVILGLLIMIPYVTIFVSLSLACLGNLEQTIDYWRSR